MEGTKQSNTKNGAYQAYDSKQAYSMAQYHREYVTLEQLHRWEH